MMSIGILSRRVIFIETTDVMIKEKFSKLFPAVQGAGVVSSQRGWCVSKSPRIRRGPEKLQ